MSNVWDRLKYAKPINRLAKAVGRKAHVDDLPPPDQTIRTAKRRKEWREGYDAGINLILHGTETENPYQGNQRSEWYSGMDEAVYQLQEASRAKRR